MILAAKRIHGFTLVEVLASLVFVAVVLPAAMKAISTSTTAAALAADRSEAVALADDLLAEVILTEAWRDGDGFGEFDEHEGFRWRIEVADWQGVVVQQLAVHVSWTTAGREHVVTLTTLIYDDSSITDAAI